jgi:hypothetical protein
VLVGEPGSGRLGVCGGRVLSERTHALSPASQRGRGAGMAGGDGGMGGWGRSPRGVAGLAVLAWWRSLERRGRGRQRDITAGLVGTGSTLQPCRPGSGQRPGRAPLTAQRDVDPVMGGQRRPRDPRGHAVDVDRSVPETIGTPLSPSQDRTPATPTPHTKPRPRRNPRAIRLSAAMKYDQPHGRRHRRRPSSSPTSAPATPARVRTPAEAGPRRPSVVGRAL